MEEGNTVKSRRPRCLHLETGIVVYAKNMTTYVRDLQCYHCNKSLSKTFLPWNPYPETPVELPSLTQHTMSLEYTLTEEELRELAYEEEQSFEA